MAEFKTVEEIFELENLDANAISITGIPERHMNAVIAIAKLFVVIDHENKNFQPDFTNYRQSKYSPIVNMDVGFSSYDYGRWFTFSNVGSRLCFESREKAKTIFNNHLELYKAFMIYQRPIK